MPRLPGLSARLKLAADMVRPGGIVADIGTDHAYLPVYLVNSGKNSFAYAADIRQGPLERAGRTIREYGAEGKVKPVLSDGLKEIPFADDVVIAGMGGELIARILSESAFIRNSDVELVLQPMTTAPELRLFLCRSGFTILREAAAAEGKRLYVVMSAYYSGQAFEPDGLFCHCGRLLETGGPEGKALLLKEADKLLKQAKGRRLSETDSDKAEQAEKLAKEIRSACLRIGGHADADSSGN